MIRSAIEDAIRTKSYIEIEYSNAKGKKSIRAIADIKLKKDDRYISAFCCNSREYRTFKVSRISSIRSLSEEEIKKLPSYKLHNLTVVVLGLVSYIILGGLIYLFPGFFLSILKLVGIGLVLLIILAFILR